VEEAQEADPEPEPEGGGILRLVVEGGVRETELLKGVPEVLDAALARREHAAEDHGFGFLEAREGRRCRLVLPGDGLADPGVGQVFHPGDDVADLAGPDPVRLDRLGREVAEFLDFVLGFGGHQQDPVAGVEFAVDDPDEDDDPAIGIEPGIEKQRLERRLGVSLGGRDPVDDPLKHGLDAGPPLGADEQRLLPLEADDVFHLVQRLFDVRLDEIDLVDDGDEDQVVLDGEVGVGHGLGFDALGGVDDQHRPVAGGEAPRDFVGKIHVARRVDQVEDVFFARFRPEQQSGRLGLDRDPPFPFEVHGVQDLLLELPGRKGAREFDAPVGQGGFPVVHVGDDRKIADILHPDSI